MVANDYSKDRVAVINIALSLPATAMYLVNAQFVAEVRALSISNQHRSFASCDRDVPSERPVCCRGPGIEY